MNQYNYLKVKDTEDGKGVFATEDIPAGFELLRIEGKILDFEETLRLGDKESFTLQIENDKYIALHFPFFLVNHSCDPNCGVTPALVFKTIKQVKKGEELRWDYSTSMLERSWTMTCNCGSSNCRGVIEDFDKIPIKQQQYYLEHNLVMPFIRQRLRK